MKSSFQGWVWTRAAILALALVSALAEPTARKSVMVDSILGRVGAEIDFDNTFTRIVWKLHAQLLVGPPGQILLGLFGLALMLSLGTGVVI